MRRTVVAAVLALGLAGCGGPTTPPGPTTPGPAADEVAARFNPTDRAWLELMIPMDQQLLPALDLAATHSADTAVRAFAAGLSASVHSELDQLRVLGGQAQLPADNPHLGMKMTGLVDAETLAGLRSSPPAAFDPALLAVVRDNVDQVARLAESEQRAGAQPQVVALAAAAATARASQRAEVTALLSRP